MAAQEEPGPAEARGAAAAQRLEPSSEKVIGGIEDWVIGSLLTVMLVIMAAGVVSRYLLPGIRIAYLDQLLPNLFVWLSMLGTASAARRSSHLGMTAIVDRLPTRAHHVAVVLAVVVGLAFFAVLAWQGTGMVQNQVRRGSLSAFGYPAWTISLAVPVGSVLAAIRIVQAAFLVWGSRQTNLDVGL
jgi:TRAP-type C4-dicarboxylate transport system permease small subunit